MGRLQIVIREEGGLGRVVVLVERHDESGV